MIIRKIICRALQVETNHYTSLCLYRPSFLASVRKQLGDPFSAIDGFLGDGLSGSRGPENHWVLDGIIGGHSLIMSYTFRVQSCSYVFNVFLFLQ